MAHHKLDLNVNVRDTKRAPSPPPVTRSAAPAGGSGSAARSSSVDDEPAPAQQAAEPRIALLRGVFAQGTQGYQFLKKAKVRVEVTVDGEKGKDAKGLVVMKLFCKFGDHPEQDLGEQAESGIRGGVAEGEVTLYYNNDHYDAGLPADKKAQYYFKAKHPKSEEKVSELLEMPHAAVGVLKKGSYDDNACQKYPATRKKGGTGHVTGTVVFDLQTHLKELGFVDVGTPDGDFGDGTDKAVRTFQDAARAKARKDKASGKIVEVTPTCTSATDGVAGDGTQKEIALWQTKGYLKADGKPAESAAPAGMSQLTNSVGEKGANKPDDVKKVKQKLKELGYPVKDEGGEMAAEDYKAIKFFQAQVIEIPTGNGAPAMPDGLISSGQNTEKKLFAGNAPKYSPPAKGTERPIESGIQKKIDAATGDVAEKWKKIKSVWTTLSPYLPTDSKLTSGYRTDAEQRDIVWAMYNVTYKAKIQETYGEDSWQKYRDLQGVNDSEADPVMCKQIKAAAGQDVAVPGKSNHRYGKAIDVGGNADVAQVRSLLWCSVEFSAETLVKKIIKERNGCVHFEFG